MPKSDKSRPSSTAGRSKGENCQRSQIKTLYAKDARFYKKHPANYMQACKLINKQKGNQKSGWIEEAEKD